MTSSSDWKTPPVILLIGLRPGARGLDRGDVDLLHRHHCFHCALRGCAIRVVRRVEQHARRDLPGEAPAILHVRSPHSPPTSANAAPCGSVPMILLAPLV